MDTDPTPTTNRLANETSPYLQQHAHNPVDWYPWGEEALARARQEDKPILLSIGYSACHWCHVMAHESFEDPETAAVMNARYVNVKVDREERPDLDKIYQLAFQLLNQRGGGWPLTMILTPEDQTPFFAGTYFPREARYGMPAFKDLLERVAAFYHEHRNDIAQQNTALRGALASTNPAGTAGDAERRLDSTPLDAARRELEQSFDPHLGGFGAAPKFPHPTSIERLLRHWAATSQSGQPDTKALDMARLTLHAMASGGIYDQLGGGFCRYSVDEHWMIPHFEKMLYDNGPLLALYSDAWAATGEAVFRRVAEETGEWAMREMQAPEGGYYSTLDADSEGEEGRFYVWTPEQAKELLSEQEYAVFAPVYGLDRPANFEGRWHLHVCAGADDVAKRLGIEPDEAVRQLASARGKLLAARERRVRPGRDEKVLTAWNGLMIKGMAVAGRRLERPDFLDSAERALDFIGERLYRDGRLLAVYKDGQARLAGYLDDYVLVIDAILELLQARWRGRDLELAAALADSVIGHFADEQEGGFFFTADDHEALIHRPKPTFDDSTPSGNGIAAYVLGRLGHLLGDERYLHAAERALASAWESMRQVPHAHGALLLGLEEYLYPPQVVILRGNGNALAEWHRRAARAYAPRRLSLAIPADAPSLPGALAERRAPSEGTVAAYVCSGMTCQAPVRERSALDEVLAGHEASTSE
ncbi:MAG TPA: thioredoxin domain-containing protein [Gammaproteobacteria bacterium]|nr:thioredoxin domain-containing protein [Gammaproteobacteria bacterium]